ncbi:MAG: S-methyl-5'-thioadenosine phosphorylase [Anaerolineales bacterium]|nr:S-methyl-5'-thioadenosine phosphorylase [Anaerolineales bacterium]
MDEKPVLGVIGGSGLYDMQDLTDVDMQEVSTPFGQPSSPLAIGKLKGRKVAFLARHGIGHIYPPTDVNYRANIYAMKMFGVERILAVSACGSLREDYVPGEIVVPDQLFDRTVSRQRSFFESGLVTHISVADPFCPDLSELVATSTEEVSGSVHRGGTYITIEGPRFSTRGESNIYRAWGISIIGMTTSPEAFLAREAEMCYAVMAHVTDYDVWHQAEEPVTVGMVFQTLKKNIDLAQEVIVRLVADLPEKVSCECPTALKNAIATKPEIISDVARKRYSLLVDRYLT